jgi:hypothetical protein
VELEEQEEQLVQRVLSKQMVREVQQRRPQLQEQ